MEVAVGLGLLLAFAYWRRRRIIRAVRRASVEGTATDQQLAAYAPDSPRFPAGPSGHWRGRR